MSTEDSPTFNFQLFKIPLTPKDCINMIEGNEQSWATFIVKHSVVRTKQVLLTHQTKTLEANHSLGGIPSYLHKGNWNLVGSLDSCLR